MSESRKLAFVACIQIIVSMVMIYGSEASVLGTTYDAHPVIHVFGVCALIAAFLELGIALYMAIRPKVSRQQLPPNLRGRK